MATLKELGDKVDRLTEMTIELKSAIIGNGTKGLSERVNELECKPLKNKAFAISLGAVLIAALGAVKSWFFT